jgi:VWFA-related protein
LYEAVYIAQHELGRVEQGDEPRRQAVVVLSDGEDTRSWISFDDVLGQAQRSAVTVFTIMPSPPVPDWARRAGRGQQVRFDMRRLAEVTGGRAFAPANIADLEPIYWEIGAELGQQYLLGYVPSAPREGFRRVSVRVETRPGLRARTRSGYYAGTSRLDGAPASRSGQAR